MRVGLLTAMPSELRPFGRAIGLQRDGDVHRGTLAGHEVVATVMGVGMEMAAKAAERLLDAGPAGMLNPDGTPDIAAAVRYMMRKPWRIPRLLRLGRDSQRAAKAAADAAIAALRASAGA